MNNYVFFFHSLPRTGSSLFSPEEADFEEFLLSNRYLIYTLETGCENYFIYDFLKKQLITDRPRIMSLIHPENAWREFAPYRYEWYGEDKLFVFDNYHCNLWDIETNQIFYVWFDVSNHH